MSHRTQDSDPPFSVSDKTVLRMPLSFHISILAAVALGVAAWVEVRAAISEHADRITQLEMDAKSKNEILIRIDERTAEMKRQLDRAAR